MLITANEISTFLGGEVVGDPEVQVHSPSKIEEGKEGTISFLANPKYEAYAYSTEASILLVEKSFVPTKSISSTLIKVDDVYASIGLLLDKFGKIDQEEFSISSLAVISNSAELASQVSVGEFSVIRDEVKIGENTIIHTHVNIGKNCTIGKNCILYPGVVLYPNCVIGSNCILHAGAVIGSDGFGYSKDDEGKYTKIQHVGNVILEDNVEVGCNTVIDRATMGSTIIRKGVKLDNLIQIAHNVELGENTALAAQVGIAGSTKLGKGVMVGGQVGIAGHKEIADFVQIQGKSGVISSIKEVGKRLFGYPALEYKEFLRAFASMKRLPALIERINAMEKELGSKKENTSSENESN